jgi:multidrug resistance efflux pump
MRSRRILRLGLLAGLSLVVPILILTGCLGSLFPPGSSSGGKDGDAVENGTAEQALVCYGYADVEHGVIALYPSQTGRVKEIPVSENQAVKARDVLLRLDDRASQFRVEEAKATLEAAQAQLARAEKGSEQHQLKIAQQEAAVTAARHRVANARHTLTAREKLREIEAVGRSGADPVGQSQVEAARENVKELEAVERTEQAKLADLRLHDSAIELRHARAELATMQARLDQAQQALEEHTLRAPEAGTVLRILVGPGDLLGAQPKKVIQFCSQGPRIIRAEVDQAFASRVSVGQAASIEDDVRSGGSWRGRVARLSDWYTQRRLIAEEVLQPKDIRTLECLVTLDEDQLPLRIGQRVRVTLGRQTD